MEEMGKENGKVVRSTTGGWECPPFCLAKVAAGSPESEAKAVVISRDGLSMAPTQSDRERGGEVKRPKGRKGSS
jgi:hypothetical protein